MRKFNEIKAGDILPNEVWAVNLTEYDRFMGSKPDGRKLFPSYEDAKNFMVDFNSYNTGNVVPEWYMTASDPYKL